MLEALLVLLERIEFSFREHDLSRCGSFVKVDDFSFRQYVEQIVVSKAHDKLVSIRIQFF